MTRLIIKGLDNEPTKDTFSFESADAKLALDGTYEKARGGTEMMRDQLFSRVDPLLLNKFAFTISRVVDFDRTKPNLLWLHDTFDDPAAEHLRNKTSRQRFAKLVFVSNYQQLTYNMGLGVPYSDGVVIKNAIEPIDIKKKEFGDTINLIYHTTPHRGLEILVPVFEKMYEVMPNIHLDVFSSFEIYGWSARNEPYEPLFEFCRNHPGITYHGYQPNSVVREALKKAHVYAYPNIWPETSCLSVIEAMSAKCVVVCPNFAVLPETTGGFATMYPYQENPVHHTQLFAQVLYSVLGEIRDTEQLNRQLDFQKIYIDGMYNWDSRANEWAGFLEGMANSLGI